MLKFITIFILFYKFMYKHVSADLMPKAFSASLPIGQSRQKMRYTHLMAEY